MRYVHISGSRRRDGNSGGVEKFAWYLEQAIGCELLTDTEYTGWYDGNTIFIVDGDHGKNIPQGAPIVSVAHGTWAGLHRRWQKQSIGDYTEKSQIARWHQPNVKVVSVSPGVTHELRTLCGVEPVTEIWHGIHTKLPTFGLPFNRKPVVLYASKSPGKGYDLMPEIQRLLPDFELRYLNAGIGEELNKFMAGDMYLHASLSDGNSYACLEAMTCDLPCVVTNVGLFHDFNEDKIGRILPYTSSAEDYADAIEAVYNNEWMYYPRDWILQNATFETFKAKWEVFLASLS
jgi:hypothetical protein